MREESVKRAAGLIERESAVRIDVLYFGVLKEFFGGERDVVELPEGANVDGLLQLLRARAVTDMPLWSSLAVAVNREYAGLSTLLRDRDEVALLPPVSGGCDAS